MRVLTFIAALAILAPTAAVAEAHPVVTRQCGTPMWTPTYPRGLDPAKIYAHGVMCDTARLMSKDIELAFARDSQSLRSALSSSGYSRRIQLMSFGHRKGITWLVHMTVPGRVRAEYGDPAHWIRWDEVAPS